MRVSASSHESVAAAFKAVADPTRVAILATILAAGELCVCHVESALDLTQSRASRHLTTLKRAGLVVDRREGAWVHYSTPRQPEPTVRAILDCVRAAVASDPKLAAVAKQATAIRARSGCGGPSR